MNTRTFCLTFLALLPGFGTHADEGMWLPNHLPLNELIKKYDFAPSAQWLEHLQKSSVRFNSGGSGSFVSEDGLVLTNHHVAVDCLQKLSTSKLDFVNTSFYASKRAGEARCPDLELNVLMSIEDVTQCVKASVRPTMSLEQAAKARRAAMNTIENESLEKTTLRSDVVTLHNGGKFHLYRYKKYTDIRLVFAPEKDIAYFGGDTDNFEYPRYDLDVTFFRAYENDAPAKIAHYLKWNANGAKDNEVVVVSGHPGHTERGHLLAHLEFLRDVSLPKRLSVLRRREILLRGFSERSIENARRAQDELFGYQNALKSETGSLANLYDPAIMSKKRVAEDRLLTSGDAKKAAVQIQSALKAYRQLFDAYSLLERQAAFNSQLFDRARTLVRLAREKAKPNSERFREYRESNLESLMQDLLSEAPIYDDLESLKLADSLQMFLEVAGPRQALATKILNQKSPKERALELISNTQLKDLNVRKRLVDGGIEAIQASTDPMIKLALLVDDEARAVRRKYESEIEEPMRQAYGKLADSAFALYKDSVYPDATFTLRLAFGKVRGYVEDGRQVPAWTTIGGAFAHADAHQSREPFQLPKTWLANKDRLKLETPFNFVSTNDITGGNSGSPVVNREGEFVGIIFDGNLQSFVWDYLFDEEQARAVSVHSAGITESLRKIYGTKALLNELGV